MNKVETFIAIGSNLGDRTKNVRQAIKLLTAVSGIKVEKVSSIIETNPEGGIPQPKYLNGVLKATTCLSPWELLEKLRIIEHKLGRKREEKNGPRTIDLDILLYGNRCINEPDLQIPHPKMTKRDFVMKPLLEIAPEKKEELVNGE